MMGARTSQADLTGNGAFKADAEVAIMRCDVLAIAVFDELLDGRFYKSHSTIVAMKFDVFDEIVDGIKAVLVFPAGEYLQAVPFVKHCLGPEVTQGDGNGFAVVAIGRIAHQAGPSVCLSFNDHRETA